MALRLSMACCRASSLTMSEAPFFSVSLSRHLAFVHAWRLSTAFRLSKSWQLSVDGEGNGGREAVQSRRSEGCVGSSGRQGDEEESQQWTVCLCQRGLEEGMMYVVDVVGNRDADREWLRDGREGGLSACSSSPGSSVHHHPIYSSRHSGLERMALGRDDPWGKSNDGRSLLARFCSNSARTFPAPCRLSKPAMFCSCDKNCFHGISRGGPLRYMCSTAGTLSDSRLHPTSDTNSSSSQIAGVESVLSGSPSPPAKCESLVTPAVLPLESEDVEVWEEGPCLTATPDGSARSEQASGCEEDSGEKQMQAAVLQALERSLGYPLGRNSQVPRPQPLVIVISGPSGVGKDVVIKTLQEMRSDIHFVVTATTRPQRPGEVDGRDYFFVSKAEFQLMIEKGELLEHALVYGDFKGIPKQQVRDCMAKGTDVVLRVDVQGAATLRSILGSGAVFIFLVAESEVSLVKRLLTRKTETLDKLILRIATAREELKRLDEFDYAVVNADGELDKTVSTICSIIDAEKSRVRQRIATV